MRLVVWGTESLSSVQSRFGGSNRTWESSRLLVLGSFSHDSGSGVAGVFLKPEQGIARNILQGLAKELLLRDIEQLDSSCLSTVGHCQYLEYSSLIKRHYEVASNGSELLISHAKSFLQVGCWLKPRGFQTAPRPGMWCS